MEMNVNSFQIYAYWQNVIAEFITMRLHLLRADQFRGFAGSVEPIQSTFLFSSEVDAQFA